MLLQKDKNTEEILYWELPNMLSAERFRFKLRQALHSAKVLEFDPYNNLKDQFELKCVDTKVFAYPKYEQMFTDVESGTKTGGYNIIDASNPFDVLEELESLSKDKTPILVKKGNKNIVIKRWAEAHGMNMEVSGGDCILTQG